MKISIIFAIIVMASAYERRFTRRHQQVQPRQAKIHLQLRRECRTIYGTYRDTVGNRYEITRDLYGMAPMVIRGCDRTLTVEKNVVTNNWFLHVLKVRVSVVSVSLKVTNEHKHLPFRYDSTQCAVIFQGDVGNWIKERQTQDNNKFIEMRPQSNKYMRAKTTGRASGLDFVCVNKNDELCRHPTECSQFVSCANELAYEIDCPAGLLFNPETKLCDYKENVKCWTYIGETSYGAKGSRFGTVVLTKENFKQAGRLTQILLEHVSGYVKCSAGSAESYWGCNNNGQGTTYGKEIIGTVVTDANDKVLYRQQTIPGYNGMSPSVLFKSRPEDDPNQIPSLPYTLRIWYDEDLKGFTESDNSGTHRIRVSAVVV